jgi:hypothetical protein
MAEPEYAADVSYERTLFIYNVVSAMSVERATVLVSLVRRDLSIGGWTCPCGCGVNHPTVISFSDPLGISLTPFYQACPRFTAKYRDGDRLVIWIGRAIELVEEVLTFSMDYGCSECHIPDVTPLVLPTSDIMRTHNPTECARVFKDTYSWCIYQFLETPFRNAIGLPAHTSRDLANWLTGRWKERLSNLHRLFLVNVFLNPLERYSPFSRLSPLSTTPHPTIFKGPSPTNLKYLADLEKAEVAGVYRAMKARYECQKVTTRKNALGEVQREAETMSI